MTNKNPWLSEYPKGVSETINPDEYTSLRDIIDESVSNYAELPAYTNMGVTLRFEQIDEYSQQMAIYFQQTLGLKKGDRLAIMMPNLLQYPIVLFGAIRAGLVIVNVNPLYTARELHHQLNDSGATAIVILENFAHVLAEVIEQSPIRHVTITRIGDMLGGIKGTLINAVIKYIKKMVPKYQLPGAHSWKQALQSGSKGQLSSVKIEAEDLAFLQYTGGTTGVSKGAMLTHRNMIANLLQAKEWVNFEIGKEAIITALPLYHIFSLTANCLMFLKIGGCNILITNPKDIPAFVKTLKTHKFTFITGVNTLFNALLNHPEIDQVDFSHLKISLGGGMAVQASVAKRWKQQTGNVLLEAYGLTETSPAVCVNPIDLKEYNGAIGLPLPSTEVAILDENGAALAPMEEGELCVKGPQVMRGYWQKDTETKAIFTKDGWLRTGDMAQIDEKGFVRIVGRQKDMILVSGFNVYPNEIEDVVMKMPGILEVAAIGIPDDHSGERIKLFVVKKEESITKKAIIDYCKEHLTQYKLPKDVEFCDSLPKTNVGKVLHRALREEPPKKGPSFNQAFDSNIKKHQQKKEPQIK